MKRTLTTAVAALALLAGCSAGVNTTEILTDQWHDLGEGGQQKLCQGYNEFGGDWMADQYQHGETGRQMDREEIVEFFEARC